MGSALGALGQLKEDKTEVSGYEELHKACKELFPQPFDGAKLLINKGLSSRFQVSHTLTLNNTKSCGYKFGTTFVGSKTLDEGKAEAFPVLMGEIDPSLNLNANIIHAFGGPVPARTKLVTQFVDGQCQALQGTIDFRGPRHQLTFTVGNPDLLSRMSGIYVAQYVQNVTSRFKLGSELMVQRGHAVPGFTAAILSLGGVYRGEKWVGSATVSPSTLSATACYSRRLDETTSVAVDLEANYGQQEACATVGYSYEVPKADCTIKAQVDTHYNVATTIEKKMLPMPYSLVLSGAGNQRKCEYKFGIGFMLG